jgi:ubiquinone/menaquinone biosynthesis C-methylase UbiE
MMPRRLEPEVMDTEEEAMDYDAMDHTAVNQQFCADFLAAGPDLSRVLDVGTGTGLIPIALCRLREEANVLGTDLSKHMVVRAQCNVEAAGLEERVEFVLVDAKAPTLPPSSFSAVMSNSIVHHIPEPELALQEMFRLCKRGGLIFVRDLARPDTEGAVEALVSQYGGTPASTKPADVAAWERQTELFRASLHAALRVPEVQALLLPLGVPASAVTMTSDRHWTLSFRKGA